MQQVWSFSKWLWRSTWRTARMGPWAVFMLPMAMLMFVSYAFVMVGVGAVLIGFAVPCALLVSPLLVPVVLAKLYARRQQQLQHRARDSSIPPTGSFIRYRIRKRAVLNDMDDSRRVRAERWFSVAEQATRMHDVPTARYAWSRIDGLRS